MYSQPISLLNGFGTRCIGIEDHIVIESKSK